MRRVLRRLSLLGRFSLLSLAALALTGVAVGVALHQRIEHRAIDSAKSLAIATASTGAQASLSEADLTAPLSVARLHELDRTLSSPLAGAGVIRTKVYDADGKVRYSDDRSMIVAAHGAEHEEAGSDEIAEVIESGKADTELAKGTSKNGQGEPTVSFYVPVRVGRSAEPNAVFEVYFPYEPIAAGIERDTRMLAALLALGLLVLWISIFRLVAGASRRLTRQAKEDDLTGLPNRAALRVAGARALRSSQPPGTLNALLLIDLDRFKEVNDTLGHDQGDMLLCEVAERLAEVLRPSDTLARLGGDEFAILLRDLPHRGAIAEVTTRIRADRSSARRARSRLPGRPWPLRPRAPRPPRTPPRRFDTAPGSGRASLTTIPAVMTSSHLVPRCGDRVPRRRRRRPAAGRAPPGR